MRGEERNDLALRAVFACIPSLDPLTCSSLWSRVGWVLVEVVTLWSEAVLMFLWFCLQWYGAKCCVCGAIKGSGGYLTDVLWQCLKRSGMEVSCNVVGFGDGECSCTDDGRDFRSGHILFSVP